MMWKTFKAALLVLLHTSIHHRVASQPDSKFIFQKNKNERSECMITDDDRCIQSDMRRADEYPGAHLCVWRTTGPMTLDVKYFELGARDRLRIDDVPFVGTEGPDQLDVRDGARFRFIVENSEDLPPGIEDSGDGFKICAASPPSEASVIPDDATFFLARQWGNENADCRVTDGGNCIESDGTGNYPNSFRCVWRTTGAMTLDVRYFELGAHDRLRIDDVPFRGRDGPDQVVVRDFARFRFIVEEEDWTPTGVEESGNGFKICATPPPTDPIFELTSKSDDSSCIVTNNGLCIMSDRDMYSSYNPNFTCNWRVTRDVTLHTHYFVLGMHDRLRVEGVNYTGSDDPDGETIEAGTNINFEVQDKPNTPDDMDTANGFKICSFPEGEQP